MLNFFLKGGGFILKFKRFGDIESIYNITDIQDEYILSSENDKIVKIYIYEIEPIPIINISKDIQNNISNSYITFLREINVDFQILAINKRLSLEKFLNSDIYNTKYDKYLKDMRVKLKEDRIFYSRYFIIVALRKQENIEDIDKVIGLLKNCGCNVKRLNNKKDIQDLLYECINKEDI